MLCHQSLCTNTQFHAFGFGNNLPSSRAGALRPGVKHESPAAGWIFFSGLHKLNDRDEIIGHGTPGNNVLDIHGLRMRDVSGRSSSTEYFSSAGLV